MAGLDGVLAELDQNRDTALERLFGLLRIASISTDPAYAAECRACGAAIVADLAGIGFEAALRETGGHPIVLGKNTSAGPDKPHVLFYGHYDVQPVDPLALWDTPPFEPVLRDGPGGERQIVARGASDDKGQVMTFIEACRALMAATGRLPVNVTVLIEGEEECGSGHLVPFIEASKADLAADIVLICDTSMWNRSTPAVATMLRGLLGEEVILRTADRDLHSGLYGGAVANPVHVLAQLLASFHDSDGRVTLPGFYDGVSEASAAEKASWASLGFGDAAFLQAAGATVAGGEAGRSALEKTWARPTMEVNGITGGYTGEGFKTVLPAEARAKVSFRLVGDQDPAMLRAAFRAEVVKRVPAGTQVSFIEHGGSPGVRIDLSNPFVGKALAALKDEWDKDTALIGMGGSIPVVGWFKRLTGMDSLLIGFALDDDRIHSPNEKYDLASFERGARSWVRVLAAFGGGV